ncbi:MAG: Crp/Fnr family transcriptional regulator [Proteobacteria bacterium]|nr:Crp/Fnr family transcriptional regulator [Pseudomonadota bacterium]
MSVLKSVRSEKRLLEILGRLPKETAANLLEYAEFLDSRHGCDPVATEPLTIPRPEKESVVEAIRRLSDTYPMLDTEHLLHETGDLMSQHIMQARPATEVIDDLEALFGKHYKGLGASG